MGLGDKEHCSRDDRFLIDSNGVGVEWKGPGRCLREHMKKGFTKTKVFMPLRVGGEVSPIRGPMADEFVVFGRSSCRKPCDPRIDPSDSIRDVRTVNWNFMADEEIFCDIFFDPSGEIFFLLHSPSPIAHGPDLQRRLLECLAEGGSGEKDEKK